MGAINIYLTDELSYKLKNEENRSKLISDLLIKYYQEQNKEYTKEEIITQLEIIKIKKEVEDRIKDVKNGNN